MTTPTAEADASRPGLRLDRVEDAIADIAAGRAVVVVDDADRENEGDRIFAASRATPALMAFTIRHSSGVICVPMPGEMLDRLEIPLMTPHNRDRLRTAYTVSVDARDGVTTGISAHDRAHTARVLADSATEPWEITRPGHVFPLRYREGGVLVRRGHTEAAVDLARLAGLTPAGVLVEVVHDDGTMKRGTQLREFADEHGLRLISIEQLVHYRRRTEVHVERRAETRLPTEHGQFTAFGYRITVENDGGGHQIGTVVTAIQNEVTGRMVDLTVHPYFPAGTAVAWSKTLPVPDSGISETTQIANVQDMLLLEWPVIQMSYDLSSYIYGTLLHYAPAWGGAITGIQ